MTDEERAKNPHSERPPLRNEGIMENVLEAIGNTPMVRINRIGKAAGLKCDLVAKCEFFNAGGSVKDRIGYRMVQDAIADKRINLGDTLIEPTSGNTGIGLALSSAVLGYKMVITMPEKMSDEKVNILKALGAEIIRTPNDAAFDAPESHIGVATKLNNEIPNSHILDQYKNPGNPLAHYDGTAEEILKQCGGKVDMIVATAGTGGTISGIARKIKEKLPDCIIVGVDPIGSILAQPESLNVSGPMYQVEGIGYDFIPTVLDRSVVDKWIKTTDQDSLPMARRMMKEEGLLCGGSSGACMWAATQAAKDLTADQRCVVLCPDSIRNYMTKHLSVEWMIENGLMENPNSEEWWASKTVADLGLTNPDTIAPTDTVATAIAAIQAKGFDQFPVVDANGDFLGAVTEGNLTSQVLSRKVKLSDPVTNALYKSVAKVSSTDRLDDLSQIFNKNHFVVVIDDNKVSAIVTRIDLLRFVSAKAQ
eukprot:TRINITY_DN12289_c0_g1_i1.p1 TRINITY_DN12289_c0_g1~~TRINITY_DN12289_c0_g1_i1.p1  ORF type:complete len:508 (+),score=149.05 TRINITY_DN12289_c0_g1_i1:91-1524(+)